MKRIGIISTSALFLVVGLTAPAFAQQDDHKDQGKPAQEQQAKPEEQHQQTQQAKPAPEQQAKPQEQAQQAHTQQAQQTKPAQETKPQQQQQAKQTQQAKPAQEQHAQQAKPQQQQQAHTQQAQQNNHPQQQHVVRTSAQQERQRSVPALRLSVRGSGRIPDDRYRANFGESHRFVISQPVMVGGYSRFQYGGFWFGFVQPWPVAWYYTDDVYVDYIDGGYYLYNPYYPGTRVSISVVL